MTFDREFIREVMAQDDAARNDFEIFQRRRATQQPSKKQKQIAPMDSEDEDTFLERCTAEGEDESTCQDLWDEFRAAPKAHQRNVMDDESSAAWNDWANSLITQRLESFASALGEDCGEFDKVLLKKIEGVRALQNVDYNRCDQRIFELTREMNALREEVRVLRGEQRSGGDVVHHLPNWRHNAAA